MATDPAQILDSPEAVLSTLTREGKRRWMYPTPSKGRYYWPRLIVGWVLISLFVALPLVRINGSPAILLDLIQWEFHLFGATFYPTDTFLLMLLMLATAIGIIAVSALLGRVWCGWACPQTVYMEFLYRPIERWIEGSEHTRKRRDENRWTFDRSWRKAAKFSVFLIVSLVLAHSFVAYFVGWDRLLHWMTQPPTEQWGYFLFMAITTGLVLFDFGYFREQMCTITCPYARFQSVLLDPDSLIVSYDPGRGEPRARRSKKVLRDEEAGIVESRGDCIDCFACVRTCPTGIDIRDGLQMECIACTACIDACDAIMDRIEKPRGLIRYTSEHGLDGKRTRLLRPRTAVYSALLLIIAGAFVAATSSRATFDVDLGRAAGAPFVELPDGEIANRLRFRVRNQGREHVSFEVTTVSPEMAEVRLVGVPPIELGPEQMTRIEAWIVFPREELVEGQVDGQFALRFSDGNTTYHRFPLLGPTE
ncbi:MAG: cytochrome c oxidase accessory protein CcoG [Bacteroidota bacterium]